MGNSSSSRRPSLQANVVNTSSRGFDDHYDVDDEAIGEGKSTQIRKATLKKYTKTERTSGVAIKLWDGKSDLHTDLKLEAEILGKCDHPNIIKLYEVYKRGKSMSLVLELCSGGKLLDRKPFTEAQASRIMMQICSAVAYLHNKNIVHRDIECGNILYATDDEDSDVKLVDFGSATELETVPNHPGAFKFLKEKTGSLHVMAPEVLKGKYGPKADVWSLGIVAYMILQDGEHPFKGSTKEEIERKIIQGSIDYRGWKHSENAKEFIQSCAMVNAGYRLTAAATLKHPWIEKTIASWKLPQELVISFDLFRFAKPLKRIALYALAKKSPPSKYRELFTSLDTTDSGTLTKEEFLTAFRNSGNSPEELEDLFEKLDVNCNDEILYTEFLAATMEAEGELEEAQLHEAFDLIAGKSKYITKKDITKMISGSKPGSKSRLYALVEESFGGMSKKARYSFEDFAQLFEHGFDGGKIRDLDTLIETSLNEDQLSQLKEDDFRKHLAPVRETSI